MEHSRAIKVLGQGLALRQQAADAEVSHVAGGEDVTAEVDNVAHVQLTHILFLERSRQMINSHDRISFPNYSSFSTRPSS